MSEKTITEREAILREREAYVRGAHIHCTIGCALRDIEDDAAKKYPLPTITRPRVVEGKRAKEGGFVFRWRLVNDVLEWANQHTDNWEPFLMDCGREEWQAVLPILRDLLANPTETVEDAA